MAISHKDFFPTAIKKSFLSVEYETLDAVLDRVNSWISASQIKVLNVETVLLPNVKEEETAKTEIRTSGEMSSYWYQIVRIWYEES